MDEYTEQLEQLLAEWQYQSAVQNVIQNILDEPIPEATRKRLLPKPIPAPRKRKLEKRQTVLREFDPLHDKTKPKLGVKRSQLLSLVADQNLTKPPHYILLREVGAGALTGYGATVPVGHRLEAAKIVLGSSGLSSRFFVASGMGSSRMFCIHSGPLIDLATQQVVALVALCTHP